MTEHAETAALTPLVSKRRLEELLGRDRQTIARFSTHAGRFYHSYDQRPPGSTKWRHIDRPVAELAALQRRIDRRILRAVVLPPTMLGAVSGKSIKDHVAPHVKHEIVATLDLKNCFPRTHDRAVFQALRARIGCSAAIASELTKLTTFRHRLPQGSPSSPTLANHCLLPLHAEVRAISLKYGVTFTFWVDDIVLSGGPSTIQALQEVIRAVHRHSHTISRRKLHIMQASGCQLVTGVSVNRKVSVRRGYRAGLRVDLRRAARTGITAPGLARARGQVAHVDFICREQANPLKELLDRAALASVIEGGTRQGFEYRECRCARRHRYE